MVFQAELPYQYAVCSVLVVVQAGSMYDMDGKRSLGLLVRGMMKNLLDSGNRQLVVVEYGIDSNGTEPGQHYDKSKTQVM
jgi:hypothetical protein